MTKADFIKAVQGQLKGVVSGVVIGKVLEATGDVALNTLKQGGEVPLPVLGAIKVSRSAARTGRNPKTGDALEIPAKNVAKFRPSKALKDALNP